MSYIHKEREGVFRDKGKQVISILLNFVTAFM